MSAENLLSYRVLDSTTEEMSQPAQTTSPNNGPASHNHSPGNQCQLLGRTTNINLAHNVDLRAITYEGVVDENLVCPICRCPMVEPVTTACDHTFCSVCIEDAMSEILLCPIDRSVLTRDRLTRSPKVIYNQLDSLKAKCPCCESSISRCLLENHLEKYCSEAVVRCPGNGTDPRCMEKVKRKMSGQGCLHFPAECPDCGSEMVQIDVDNHRERLCKERHKPCADCGFEILRYKETEHNKECPEAIIACRWLEYGCQHRGKRKDLADHTKACSLKSVGMLAEVLKTEISSLKSEVNTLSEKNQMQERRIKFLESGSKEPDRPMDLSELSGHFCSPLSGPGSMDTFGEEYLSSLIESLEGQLGQLSANIKNLEAKQTTLFFNENIAIKNELAEIRSMQQTTAMHVRHLMRIRIQENSRRIGTLGSPGNHSEGSDGAGMGGDLMPPRRTSDSSSRDLITKL